MEEFHGSDTPESADDDDESEESSSDDKRASSLGGFLVGSSAEKTAGDKGETDEERGSFWKGLFRGGEVADGAPGAEEAAPADAAEAVEVPLDDAENATGEIPLEPLSDEAARDAVAAYNTERTTELDHERQEADPHSAEDAAIAANQLFIDKVDEQLQDTDVPVEAGLDRAEQATEAVLEDEAADAEVPAEIQVEAAEATAVPEALDESAAEDDDPATAPPTAPPSAPPTAPPGSGGGSGGMPPSPPAGPPFGAPMPPFSGGGGGFGSGGAGAGGGNPNQAPNAAAGTTPEDLADARRDGANTGLVVGGVLGYLMGRRRGRIRTERRLLPEQERLQKQVGELQQNVSNKEQIIREKAAELYNTNAATQQMMAERLDTARRATAEAAAAQPAAEPAPRVSKTETRPPIDTTEAVPFTVPVPVGVETAPATNTTEQRLPSIDKSGEVLAENVKFMSRQELLQASEHIEVDGTTLRDVYEAHQITEMGMRHILAEAYRGGDIQKAFQSELLAKQMTFERDPQIRDAITADGTSSSSGGQGAASVVAAGKAVDQGQPTPRQQASSGAMVSSAAGRPAPLDIPDEAIQSAQAMERLVVGGWLIFIGILVIIVLVLVLGRS